ncbi:MAG: PLDc_N domain-containing protein [Anaerolineaceae bacterium]|nr:PLDc_N domain-containing protein [Anaerolineaceae bacterium]
MLEKVMEYLPLLLPVLLIQVTIMIIALVDVIRREKTRGPKWIWILVILFINLIGPIIYLVAGREDE